MADKQVFKIKACCLICANGVPDGKMVWCTKDQRGGYLETYYCKWFVLRKFDPGMVVEVIEVRKKTVTAEGKVR